jgi:hypothetical protein
MDSIIFTQYNICVLRYVISSFEVIIFYVSWGGIKKRYMNFKTHVVYPDCVSGNICLKHFTLTMILSFLPEVFVTAYHRDTGIFYLTRLCKQT